MPAASSLPKDELDAALATLGATCLGVHLLAMRGAGEDYAEAEEARGYFATTWGLILERSDQSPLCLTWDEDAIGDPFRIGVIDADRLLAVPMVESQDVSALAPWSRFVKSKCLGVRVYTYTSNYALEPSNETWREVPWGIELTFESGPLLVAAAPQERFLEEPLTHDEVVIVYDPVIIQRMVALWSGASSEWT